MYNFLDPKLMPKVSSKSPATEHYEASNLINENEAIRARGFLAYTVIKPPVELEFEFLCPVNISYICLNTTVGTQKCTGIEIFAKNSSTSYTSIGKAVYDNAGLIFCNSKRYSKKNPPACFDSSKDLFFFKNDKFRLFVDASALKVVIFRTGRSVPCLGSIKVFGEPSRTCSQTTVATLKRIMGRNPALDTVAPSSTDETSKIPEEFKDALTCEIMAIPMTLPCGKTVDRDTLDKHIENEKSFGRKPCDPFTGLKFTETRKPIMNMALKSRIDMFLLQNSHESAFHGLKRALGGYGENNGFKKIKLDVGKSVSKKCCVCDGNEVLYVIPCKHFYCRECLLNLKRSACNECNREFSKSEAERYFC